MLPALCGRDPAHLDVTGIARAVVESVAENSSDAIVTPLLWGALAGPAGLAGYRTSPAVRLCRAVTASATVLAASLALSATDYPRHSRSAAAASDKIARARLRASATVRPAHAASSQPGQPLRFTKTRAAGCRASPRASLPIVSSRPQLVRRYSCRRPPAVPVSWSGHIPHLPGRRVAEAPLILAIPTWV